MRLAFRHDRHERVDFRRLRRTGPSGWPWRCCALVAAAELTHDRLFHREGSASAGVAGEGGGPAARPRRTAAKPTTTRPRRSSCPRASSSRPGSGSSRSGRSSMPKEVGVTGRIEADPEPPGRDPPPGLGRGPDRAASCPGPKVKKGDDPGRPRQPRRRLGPAPGPRAAAGPGDGPRRGGLEGRDRRQHRGHDRAAPQGGRGAGAGQAVRRQAARARSGATLLSAYAELEIAAHEAGEADRPEGQRRSPASTSSSSPSTPARRRRRRFDAALEQVRFDVAQQDRIARQIGPERRGDGRRRRAEAPDPGRDRGHQRPPGPPRAGLGAPLGLGGPDGLPDRRARSTARSSRPRRSSASGSS